jgi:glycosyltransferase involved in cell wall biosynthesis
MARRSIAFMWPGLPDYAARQIKTLIENDVFEVDVIATKPKIPIKGMEHSLGKNINWIAETHDKVSWETLGLKIPDFVFQGGWAHKAFNALSVQAKNSGARIFLMNDQNFSGTFLRSWVDPLRYRLLYRHRFSGALVPGRSAAYYMQYLGFNISNVKHGLYGADLELFTSHIPLVKRPFRILFAGQFVNRKNVVRLVRVFEKISHEFPLWSLSLVGSGELKSQLSQHVKIEVVDFLQPSDLAKKMGNSRVLVLPSYEEHWGLVVHEAAACGCALLLSKQVGSVEDLAMQKNALLFDAWSDSSLEQALRSILVWTDSQWTEAETQSRSVAQKFSPAVFAAAVHALIEEVW